MIDLLLDAKTMQAGEHAHQGWHRRRRIRRADRHFRASAALDQPDCLCHRQGRSAAAKMGMTASASASCSLTRRSAWKRVEHIIRSRVLDNSDSELGYRRIRVERPLRLRFHASPVSAYRNTQPSSRCQARRATSPASS